MFFEIDSRAERIIGFIFISVGVLGLGFYSRQKPPFFVLLETRGVSFSGLLVFLERVNLWFSSKYQL